MIMGDTRRVPLQLRLITYLSPGLPVEFFEMISHYLEEKMKCPVYLIYESRWTGPPEGRADPFTLDHVDLGEKWPFCYHSSILSPLLCSSPSTLSSISFSCLQLSSSSFLFFSSSSSYFPPFHPFLHLFFLLFHLLKKNEKACWCMMLLCIYLCTYKIASAPRTDLGKLVFWST